MGVDVHSNKGQHDDSYAGHSYLAIPLIVRGRTVEETEQIGTKLAEAISDLIDSDFPTIKWCETLVDSTACFAQSIERVEESQL